MFSRRVFMAAMLAAVASVSFAADDPFAEKATMVGAASLGKASGAVKSIAGGAKVRLYSKGAIYWSAETGTHAIYGPAYTKYKALGAEKSKLGLPVTDGAAKDDEIILQHGGIMVGKGGKVTVRTLPNVTFTQSGATWTGNARMASTNDAIFIPPVQPTAGDTTITCGCRPNGQRLAIGNCSVTLQGSSVSCNQGSCSGYCQITIKN